MITKAYKYNANVEKPKIGLAKSVVYRLYSRADVGKESLSL